MNPTDSRGSVSEQSNVSAGSAGLPSVQPGYSAPAAQPAAAVPQEQQSVLDATLHQLGALSRQYAADPYMQTREIERLKAAYLYQEFGRTIKGADN